MSITDAMSRLARAELGVMLETIYAESLWPGMTFEDKDDMLQSMHYQDCCEFVREFMDPAPIDEAWLREMGGKPTEWSVDDWKRFGGTHGLWASAMHKSVEFGDDDEAERFPCATRGRFRALLHGLGMEVKS